MEKYTADFTPRYGGEDRKAILKSGVEVRWVDIPKYFKNRFLVECINFYWRYREFGFPFGGGWADQLNLHMEVIETLTAIDQVYGNFKL